MSIFLMQDISISPSDDVKSPDASYLNTVRGTVRAAQTMNDIRVQTARVFLQRE